MSDEKSEQKGDETQEEEDNGEEETTKEESSPSDSIDRANAAAARQEKANEKHETLLIRQEKIAVQNALGGKSDAGQVPEKPKEETAKEYKDRVMAGNLDEGT